MIIAKLKSLFDFRARVQNDCVDKDFELNFNYIFHLKYSKECKLDNLKTDLRKIH